MSQHLSLVWPIVVSGLQPHVMGSQDDDDVVPTHNTLLWRSAFGVLIVCILGGAAWRLFKNGSYEGSHERTKLKAGVWPATSGAVSGLGLCIVASSVLLHFLPPTFSLFNYCWDFGCFQNGCDQQAKQTCIPALSGAVVKVAGHPASQFRYGFGMCMTYVRAPTTALLMHWAYQRIMKDTRQRVAFIFESALILVAILEIVAASVPNEDPLKQMHAAWCTFFLSVWLGVVVPLYVHAFSDAGYNGRPLWVVWLILASGCVWLLVSWRSALGLQWIVCEWACIFGNSVLLVLVGASVPHAPKHKHAMEYC